MTIKQVADRSGIPYGTLIEHKKRGLLHFRSTGNGVEVSENNYVLYLKLIDNYDTDVNRIVTAMLLTLDDTIGQYRVDNIQDMYLDSFQLEVEPLVRDFQEKLVKIVDGFLYKT